jgi:hypothetical protein
MTFLIAGFVIGLTSASVLLWLAFEKNSHFYLWTGARIVYIIIAAFLFYHSLVYLLVFLGIVQAPPMSESLYSALLRPVTWFFLASPTLVALLHRWR